MSTRNPQRRATAPAPSTAPAPAKPNSNGRSASRARSRQAALNLPIEGHRILAAVALLAMLVMSLVPQGAAATVHPSVLLMPTISGRGSVPEDATLGTGTMDRFSAMFPYVSLLERSAQNTASVWPSVSDALSYDPTSTQTRRAIVGSIYASTSGALNLALRDTGLSSTPDAETLNAISGAYAQMGSNDQKFGRAINGLASVDLVQSISETPDRRAALDQDAVFGFTQAVQENPETWQFSYNWALANLLVGNYGAAREGMHIAQPGALNDKSIWPYFWAGVAALREGNPAEAISVFNDTINMQPPQDATEGNKREWQTVQDLARQGLADAQWANRNPVEAYNSYMDLMKQGAPVGVYTKWLRLGVEQHAYEKLVVDMKNLTDTAAGQMDATLIARIHHDRARLLTFLGRSNEALNEYRLALAGTQSEPGLYASYAQALEEMGDHSAAIDQAQLAISAAGKDPGQVDLTSAASTAVSNTLRIDLQQNAQALLDAYLVRARAWANSGHADLADAQAQGIVAPAAGRSAAEGGMLNLYSAFAYEAAGNVGKARDAYQAAWNLLKNLPKGQPGRAAALAGLARATASASGPQAGIDALKKEGYDPATPQPSVATDPDASDILTEGSVLLDRVGQKKQAANALRVAAIVENMLNAKAYIGAGRPIWAANGTFVPAQGMLGLADTLRRDGGNAGEAILRYRQAYGLQPALAPAFNNLGVLYNQLGNKDLAKFYLQSAGVVSPGYTWGQQNLASLAYKQGDFFTGESAQAQLIKSAGPSAADWGFTVRPDDRGGLPGPNAPSTSGDPLSRLPAIVLIALLLAHTIIDRDRTRTDPATKRDALAPAGGILSGIERRVNAAARSIAPGLVKSRGGLNGLLLAIALPVVLGALALAWHAGHGWLDVALVFVPVSLLAALIAFGANELAQHIAARRTGGATLHHTWPFGVLLGLITIPFGFMYGWGATTRVQPATGGTTRKPSTTTEVALAEEAQIEAEADEYAATPTRPARTITAAPAADSGPMARLGLNAASSIMFAGMLANVALGLVFGLAYLLTGWSSLRLGMLASLLVLAFTAVSEPPADGWTLYRRNPALWLGVFLVGSLGSVMLVAGII